MTHLSFDELLNLAEASAKQEGFDDFQIEQLEHLKTCKDCYESFCLLSALSDVMSESGGYALNGNSVSAVNKVAKALTAKVLARFQVIRSTAAGAIGAVLEQLDQATSSLQFGPSLAMATRGTGKNDSTAIRLEEFEDEKTYVVFKPDTNEIGIQINVRGLDVENLQVYIEFDDSSRMELPTTRRGSIVKGTIGDVPNSNFQIVVEAE